MRVPLRLLVLLLLVLAPSTARAHTAVILHGTLVVAGDAATLTLELRRRELLDLVREPGQLLTRGQLDALMPRLRAAFAEQLRLGPVDAARSPDLVAYLPDLLGQTQEAALPLGERLAFVLVWQGPPRPGAPQLRSRLYERQTVYCTIDLRVTGVPGVERLQVASEGFLPFEPGETQPTQPHQPAQEGGAAPHVAPAAPREIGFWRACVHMVGQGFVHILPYGVDHVLFVLGLYLANRRLRPLLIQLTAFTVAHTVTLTLAVLELIRLGPHGRSLVEIGIALSIVAVGIENCWRREPGRWRWLLVFAFGLLHGLGFASVMSEIEIARRHIGALIVGFSIGVDLGQIAVILAAAALTGWFWKRDWYRPVIAVPGSVAIALIALWWAGERALAMREAEADSAPSAAPVQPRGLRLASHHSSRLAISFSKPKAPGA